MDPLKETVRAETRRQFFGTAARGIGGLALANLFAEERFRADHRPRPGRRPARSAALRAEGEALHLPAHDGRAAADGPARLQAEDEGVLRPGPARLDPAGATPDDDDLRAVALPDRSIGLRVLAARRERRLVLRAPAPHRQHGGRHRDHPLHAHRRDQPRAGHHLHPDRPADPWPPVHRLLVRLRPRQHEREPAHLRGHERGTQPSRGRPAGDLGQALERRVPLTRIRRRRAPDRRRAGALSQGFPRASHPP